MEGRADCSMRPRFFSPCIRLYCKCPEGLGSSLVLMLTQAMRSLLQEGLLHVSTSVGSLQMQGEISTVNHADDVGAMLYQPR